MSWAYMKCATHWHYRPSMYLRKLKPPTHQKSPADWTELHTSTHTTALYMSVIEGSNSLGHGHQHQLLHRQCSLHPHTLWRYTISV